MKAAVFKEKGVLKVEDVPDPQPAPHEVLLKIKYCAICGSDLHRYLHGMLVPGTILGHEYTGEVVAKGDDVDSFEIGDRVARWDISPTRKEPGHPRFNARTKGLSTTIKPGAYAEYMAVDADAVIKIPDSVQEIDISMAEPLAVAVHAVRLSNIKPGDTVLVLGAGPIGLLVQQYASLVGTSDIYVSDPNAARRDVALKLGAKETFDPLNVNVVDEIVKHTETGVNIAFECAGARTTLQDAMESLCIAGQAVFVALAWEPVYCLPVEWVGREVEMKAVYESQPEDWAIVMHLFEEKKVRIEPMLSPVVRLEDIDRIFQELLKPNTTLGQVVVDF